MQEIGQAANNLVNAGIAMMPVVGGIVVCVFIAVLAVFAMAFGTMRNKRRK